MAFLGECDSVLCGGRRVVERELPAGIMYVDVGRGACVGGLVGPSVPRPPGDHSGAFDATSHPLAPIFLGVLGAGGQNRWIGFPMATQY